MGILDSIKVKVERVLGIHNHVPKAYKSYYVSRTIRKKEYLCHAPFSNMYFNSLGDVANCWLTFDQPEKYSEEKSIKDIWNGEKFSILREHIKNFDLEKRCNKCKYYIDNQNFTNALSKAYDNEYPVGDYPTMMEFELSNTCNLECTMCTGLLSSAIRANREKLPALKSPYGEKFVQELKEFIPHLYEARFNGGEPFLIKRYYEIWDQFIELNPQCKMVIATNGTTLNERAKTILSKGNFHINISIDSLKSDRYAEIRVNGDLDKVKENFLYFKEYCQKNKRNICVMINPMRNNWDEMGDFVRFCNEHNVHLWFNTIMYPEELSIWKLSFDELENIYHSLSKEKFTYKLSNDRGIFQYNVETFNNLVQNQIKKWLEDAENREHNKELDDVIDYRNLFFLQLNIYSIEQKDESLSHIIGDKIREVEIKIGDSEQVQKFYQLLNQVSISVLVENIQENDVDILIEKFNSII